MFIQSGTNNDLFINLAYIAGFRMKETNGRYSLRAVLPAGLTNLTISRPHESNPSYVIPETAEIELMRYDNADQAQHGINALKSALQREQHLLWQ